MSGENVSINKCVICGDRANGFNFNVLSCESCKAFFRRNVSKQMQLKCIFKGNCVIDTNNRKLCRFCRLKKCLTTGMKKELLLSDEQKKVRKNGKENNKSLNKTKIRQQNKDIDNISELITDENSDSPKDTEYDGLKNDSYIEEISECQQKNFVSKISSFDDDSDDGRELLADSSIVPICRPISDYRNTFTEVEGNYLTELFSATSILKIPFGSMTSEATNWTDAWNVLISARVSDIRRYVSMSKSLMAFNTICQNDRFALLRPGVIEMFFMRNVTGYFNDNDKEYLIVPTDIEKSSTCLIDLDVFKETKPHFYLAKKEFYQKISHEWDSDEVILDLLTAIVLFTPERRRNTDPQSVRLQQHIYKYLLQRYLLLKYRTESAAKAKYWRLMNAIKSLHILLAKNRQITWEENLMDRVQCQTLYDGLDV